MTILALGLARVPLEGLWRHWSSEPLLAVLFLPVIAAWTWMWAAVGWQLIAHDRAAIWLDRGRLCTVFWCCEASEVDIASTEQVEEFKDVVLRFHSRKTKRIGGVLFEGPAGQIAVRIAHAIARQCASA